MDGAARGDGVSHTHLVSCALKLWRRDQVRPLQQTLDAQVLDAYKLAELAVPPVRVLRGGVWFGQEEQKV